MLASTLADSVSRSLRMLSVNSSRKPLRLRAMPATMASAYTYAFCTTSPNAMVAPWHPKAMPAILHPADFATWLDGDHAAALALVRPYDGEMCEQIATPDGGEA